MAYKQLITPNLDDNKKKPLYVYQEGKILTNWVGWCLAVVKAAFGATKSMGTALNAWNQDQTKHSGSYDIPDGLFVPIYWKGDKQGHRGHIAIAKRLGNQVKIWSSPYKKSATFTTFSGELKATIDKVTKTYGCTTYLGWTERVCEKTVIQAVNLKSNEEICAEIWAGKWGTGSDRKARLTNAGYDYSTIQKMVDAGVGKPVSASKPVEAPKVEEPKTEPIKQEEPAQNDSDEPTDDKDSLAPSETSAPDNSSGNSQPDSENKKDNETSGAPNEFAPAKSADGELISELISEASSEFEPPKTVKLIAYLVGDALLVAALLIPDIVNTIQAPTAPIWAEYLSKVLLESGVSILLVFKLIKKKGK